MTKSSSRASMREKEMLFSAASENWFQSDRQYPEAPFNSIFYCPHLLVETVDMKTLFWPQSVEAQSQ